MWTVHAILSATFFAENFRFFFSFWVSNFFCRFIKSYERSESSYIDLAFFSGKSLKIFSGSSLIFRGST